MKAVLFDLDQTLYPEADYVRSGFRAVAQFAARQAGLNATALEEELHAILRRDGRGRVFDTFVETHQLAHRISAATLLHLYRTHTPSIRLHHDAATLLSRLDCALGLVTDGHPTAQRAKAAALGLSERFAAVICTGDLAAGSGKPNVAGFKVCLERLGVEPGDAAYVGDDPAKDFTAPRVLGMRTVQVKRTVEPEFAFTTPGEITEADLVVEDLREAENFLRA